MNFVRPDVEKIFLFYICIIKGIKSEKLSLKKLPTDGSPASSTGVVAQGTGVKPPWPTPYLKLGFFLTYII